MYSKSVCLTAVAVLAVAGALLVLPAQAQDHRYFRSDMDRDYELEWETDDDRFAYRPPMRAYEYRTYDDDAYRARLRERAMRDPDLYVYRYEPRPYVRYYDDDYDVYRYDAAEDGLRADLERRDVTRARERKESFGSNPALRGATDLRDRDQYRYYAYRDDYPYETRGDEADDRYDPAPGFRDTDQDKERDESWSHNPALRSATDLDAERRRDVWEMDDDYRARGYVYDYDRDYRLRADRRDIDQDEERRVFSSPAQRGATDIRGRRSYDPDQRDSDDRRAASTEYEWRR